MIFRLTTFVVCGPPGELECFSLASFFQVPLGVLDLTLWVEEPRVKGDGEMSSGESKVGNWVGRSDGKRLEGWAGRRCGSTEGLGWAFGEVTGEGVMWAESGMGVVWAGSGKGGIKRWGWIEGDSEVFGGIKSSGI